jgi:hypothetical protein
VIPGAVACRVWQQWVVIHGHVTDCGTSRPDLAQGQDAQPSGLEDAQLSSWRANLCGWRIPSLGLDG